MSVNALIFTELIHDSMYSRGLGAYRIATEIRKAGYTCQVIDFFTKFNDEEMEKIMSSFIGEDTLFVGFSSTFFAYVDTDLDQSQKNQLKESKDFAPDEFQKLKDRLPTQFITTSYPYHTDKMIEWFEKIKKINPNTKIVLGGGKSGNLLGPCDAYAIGYADQATVDYMKFLEGKNPFFKYKKINDTQILFEGKDSVNNFEFSDSEIIWHKTDYINHQETVPIEIARGCIFKCKFCRYPLNGKKKLDFVKNDNILRDEFLRNYYEHGITRYIYADDTHNDSIEKLERIHKVVTSLPFELEYAAYIRHDLIHAHKETASLLRESGLRSAIFGIETLNHKSGQSIGKGLHPEKTKELLHWLKDDIWKDEVAMYSGFIVGLPYDTPVTITDWAKWLLDPSCPLDAFSFEPLYINRNLKFRPSEFDMQAEKYGYIYWARKKIGQVTILVFILQDSWRRN